jgi:hypothetical protein
MYKIFRYYDSYLANTLNRFELMNEMQTIIKELYTWGILIYNRNSIRDGKMYKIQRSKNNTVQQLIKKKLEIVKSYFTQTKDGGRYRVRDVINFAVLTKNTKNNLERSFIHTKLV